MSEGFQSRFILDEKTGDLVNVDDVARLRPKAEDDDVRFEAVDRDGQVIATIDVEEAERLYYGDTVDHGVGSFLRRRAAFVVRDHRIGLETKDDRS